MENEQLFRGRTWKLKPTTNPRYSGRHFKHSNVKIMRGDGQRPVLIPCAEPWFVVKQSTVQQ